MDKGGGRRGDARGLEHAAHELVLGPGHLNRRAAKLHEHVALQNPRAVLRRVIHREAQLFRRLDGVSSAAEQALAVRENAGRDPCRGYAFEKFFPYVFHSAPLSADRLC